MRNSTIVNRLLLVATLLLLNQVSVADTTKPKDSSLPKAPPTVTAPDAKNLMKLINDSFYHADKLGGIECSVAVDWTDFYKGLKITVPEERLHTIEGIQIHSKAIRNKTPEVTFSWLNGSLETKDQLEGGMKQIVDGFYKTYWSLMAAPPIPKASDISRIEPQPDGTTKIYESDANNKIEIDIDSRNTPTHYTFDTPAFKGTFDLQYVDSPKPSPGDLRRLSELHVVANVGASSFNVVVHVANQSVDGFNIPGHISYDVVGAYSVSLDFIGCSTISSEPIASAPSE